MDNITKALGDATDRRKETQELRVVLAENEKETSAKKADIEIPKIELFGFKLYEFSPRGLDMIFDAKKGQKFVLF